MTIRDAIIAEIQSDRYTTGMLEKALIDLGLNGDDEYSVESSVVVATAAVKVLKTMLGTKSITEGGYSITFSINERIAALTDEYSLQVLSKPVIRSPKVW